jgi:hypothetical protein
MFTGSKTPHVTQDLRLSVNEANVISIGEHDLREQK